MNTEHSKLRYAVTIKGKQYATIQFITSVANNEKGPWNKQRELYIIDDETLEYSKQLNMTNIHKSEFDDIYCGKLFNAMKLSIEYPNDMILLLDASGLINEDTYSLIKEYLKDIPDNKTFIYSTYTEDNVVHPLGGILIFKGVTQKQYDSIYNWYLKLTSENYICDRKEVIEGTRYAQDHRFTEEDMILTYLKSNNDSSWLQQGVDCYDIEYVLGLPEFVGGRSTEIIHETLVEKLNKKYIPNEIYTYEQE